MSSWKKTTIFSQCWFGVTEPVGKESKRTEKELKQITIQNIKSKYNTNVDNKHAKIQNLTSIRTSQKV